MAVTTSVNAVPGLLLSLSVSLSRPSSAASAASQKSKAGSTRGLSAPSKSKGGASRPGSATSATSSRPVEGFRQQAGATRGLATISKSKGGTSRPGSAASTSSSRPVDASREQVLGERFQAKLRPDGTRSTPAGALRPGSPVGTKWRNVNIGDKAFGWFELHHAAEEGDIRSVRGLLVVAKADIRAKCNYGNEALHIAARSGHTTTVGFLIAKRAALQEKNGNGWTPLTAAAINGHSDVVELLLEAAAKPSSADSEGRTAAMWAARHGWPDVLRALLAAGEDLRRRDHAGLTVADHAREHLEMRAMFIAMDRVNKCLIEGVKRRDLDAVACALHAGAQVDHWDEDGWRPLMWAAVHGALDLVQLLVRHGASVSMESARVAHFEALSADSEVLQILAQAGEASRRLLPAAKAGDSEQVEALLEDLANPNAVDEGTLETALMLAARSGSPDAVQRLVAGKALLERRDAAGRTALFHAVEAGQVQTVCALHHLRANAGAKCYEGNSLLQLAVLSDDTSMVQLLLAARCSPEDRDVEGLTAAHVAAWKGSAGALKVLFAFQADLRASDDKGRSCLGLAASQGHLAAVRVLMEPPKTPAKIRGEEAALGKPAPPAGKRAKAEGSQKQGRPDSAKSTDLASSRPDSAKSTDRVRSRPSPAPRKTMPAPPSPTSLSSLTAKKRPLSGTSTRPAAWATPVALQVPQAAQAQGTAPRSATSSPSPRAGSKGTSPSKTSTPPPPPAPSEDVQPFLALLEEARHAREALKGKLPGEVRAAALAMADARGRLPLSIAVMNNQVDVVALLLQHKAPVDSVDFQGYTALHFAAEGGHQRIIELLLSAAADPEIRNKHKQRPHEVATGGVVRRLLERAVVQVAAGLPRNESCTLRPVTPGAQAVRQRGTTETQRLRLEALPTELPPDLLQGHVRALLRRMGAPEPDHVEVLVDPITGAPKGHAYVDFDDPSRAQKLLGGHGDSLCGNSVRIMAWGGPAWRAPR